MPKRKKAPSPKFDLLEDGFDDDLSSNDDKPGTPIQRNAANARERARMRVLSKAFFNLKRNIPWVPADTKLSKLDTLRLAKNYITYLAATLDGQSVEDFSSNLAQPPKTAWPFIFQQVQAPEAGKTKSQAQQQQQAVAAVTSTTPPNGVPNVGQSTCSAEPKWLSYRQKDVTTGRGPCSAGSAAEDIQSSTSIALTSNHHHQQQATAAAAAQSMLGFAADSSAPASMEGVNEYSAFGDPSMGQITTSTGGHNQHQQQQQQQQQQQHHLPQHNTHQPQQLHHHHQQHSVLHQNHHPTMLHHQHHPYQGGGSVVPMHSSDGCHIGAGIGISGAYQRQHMTSIGSD